MERTEWMSNDQYPAMSTLVGSQIWWTWEVEDAFRQVRQGNKLVMKELNAKLHGQINDLVGMVRTDLHKHLRKRVNTQIIIDVHARDVIETFVRDSILDEREFEWESQLRFYWNRALDDIQIKQCTGVFSFGYEYTGLSGRLVITPLTDRCIMTLTQALSMFKGGSPAGPAGTGKTETVKDLAKTMGLRCVVFNCGEGLDHEAMGRNFSGLAQTGSWGCFDEFNRIEPQVLSVISTQIREIQQALMHRYTQFPFQGREIRLNHSVGIFVTMNPGYEGRTELPDNLKALFRPVVMVVPDMEQICQIMLFSEGFSAAKILSKKMTVLYKLAKEQLSKQNHYDFGLRALRSVLVMAGALKRSSPEFSEELVLMRALRDMNLPKFVFEDVPLFLGLIADLFPNLDCPRVRYPGLHDAVEQSLKEDGYQVLNDQVDKTIQLYETMLTRHTTMIVGPTGGGKSVVINTLKKAQTSLGLTTKLIVMNPKAVTVPELYGVLDPNTRDWTYGLLSFLFKEMNKPLIGDKKEARYMVFDGDVDAVWVENMNSVMDDNRLLTLPNSDRIRLQKHCALLFEVADLKHASPATVSRCGMVFVDPRNLGYKPHFQSWLEARNNKTEIEVLLAFFEKYIPACVDYISEGILEGIVTKKLETIIPFTPMNMTRQLCTLLESILDGQERQVTDPSSLEAVFIYCVMWSLGGALIDESRVKFDSFVKKVSDLVIVDNPDLTVGTGQLPAALPTLFDYHFDPAINKWVPWNELVQPFMPPEDGKFSSVLVPTVDTVRYTKLLDTIMQTKQPILFVGAPGTAKTSVITRHMATLDADRFLTMTMNFSSRTTSHDVRNTIQEPLERKTRDTYGPPVGRHLVTYIDDLNMPAVDKYDTQQPIAMLRLLITRGGFYELGEQIFWKKLLDVMFIGSMGPPGGGRNNVDPRFISLFNVFNITFPSDQSLTKIYTSILNHHLLSFPEQLKDLSRELTSMTLKLYRAVVQHLPPTPSKFHYIFNLRELSRVYEGLCLTKPDVFDSVEGFVRLWRNECMRIFHDRLISRDDRQWFKDKVAQLIKHYFPREATTALEEPLVYGDFEDVMAAEDARLYKDLVDYDHVRAVFAEVLEDYNDHNKNMDLVLFDQALEHLVRIHRIIRMPRGNALLVGVGGSGKRSLARLATYAAGYQLFHLNLTRNYTEESFREDLKDLYKLLGEEDKQVTFLFTDNDIVHEEFLELINNMLTSGMVPALYTDDEREQLIANIRSEVIKRNIFDSRENCWNYFVNKCRDNLHIVLCMSPAGDALRKRCRNFPGLVSNTVIDWFFRWPESALRAVGEHMLAEEDLPERFREEIISHMVNTHLQVIGHCEEFEQKLRRSNFVTPKNYLDYLSSYRTLLKQYRQQFGNKAKFLDDGLRALIMAAQEVEVMNTELVKSKAEVHQKKLACDELLAKITERNAKTKEKQMIASDKEAELHETHIRVTEEKAEAEEELANVLPLLQAARELLNNLPKEKITEIRAYYNPLQQIRDVCICVVILRGFKDHSWKGAKAMMTSPTFLKDLINFDPDSITSKQMNKVKELFSNAGSRKEMESISTAGVVLWSWVESMIGYYQVARKVAPKRERVAATEKQLKRATRELDTIKAEVSQLSDELMKLGELFAAQTAEQVELKTRAEQMEAHLTAAKKLISGLSTERTRWTTDLGDTKNKSERLVGDCLLASAFLSYTGPFTHEFRHSMMEDEWIPDVVARGIPSTSPFHVQDLLTDDVEISRWSSEGLPPDEQSVQNGILVTQSSRWPLCIDPQMQAVEWIKRMEGPALHVTNFDDNDFVRALEYAVQYGTPFLIEGVDETVDPVIEPILEKDIVTVGNQKLVHFNDKDLDWDPQFRLYMTTKVANPQYNPELFGQTMVINCCVTQQGLEEQLLSVVVGYERSDLEKQRTKLIKDTSDNKGKLKRLEDSLLRELGQSSANDQQSMLDNSELIETLEDTKSKAMEITEKLEQAKKTARDIEAVRNGFTPVAKRGAILFFAMSSLSSMNPMYEYSLHAFIQVYELSLQRAKKDTILQTRLMYIMDMLTRNFYNYVCTSLFEKHKLTFSFQMAVMILEGRGNMDHAELDFFLKGNISLEKTPQAKPFEWMPGQCWEDLQKLRTLSADFEELVDQLPGNEPAWLEWFQDMTPEVKNLPMGLHSKLNRFQQLCVLRCFRHDRVVVAVKNFITATLGEQYINPITPSIEDIYNQSTALSPITFVLSPGADPTSDIFKHGEQVGMVGSTKIRHRALGEGQEEVAKQLIEMGIARGQWILLMNCHLLTSWLKTLEKILEEKLKDKPNPDFRLWLTTEPTKEFPVGILQRSLKVVTEPPNGLRQNMEQSYSRITDDDLNACPHPVFKPLVYVLSFFHAIVQDRRKYGKVGWNISYDFNESDFSTSLLLMNTYLTKAWVNKDSAIPWGSLRYLIGEAMYGGRVTDDLDRRILMCYLNEYMGDFLFDTFQPFAFYADESFEYRIPEDGDKESYLDYIAELPSYNTPQVFGLHENAEIGYLTNSGRTLWRDMLRIQPRVNTSIGGISREKFIMNTTSDLLQKLPEVFDIPRISKTLGDDLSPTQVVLLQELVQWNELLIKMSTSLKDLERALNGEIGMSNELDDLATSLFNGQLPISWSKLTPDTEKSLGNWMLFFDQRYQQYLSWIEKGEPVVMWLSGLHVPEAYLTALVQTGCRKHGWPLDKSTLFTEVTEFTDVDQITQRPDDGCYIQGLHLEGASWDSKKKCLVAQKPKQLVEEFPIVKVVPIEANRLKLHNTFRTPVYITQKRRNAMGVGLVFEADIPSQEHESHWVLQGVSLCLTTAN
eukprot:TRINITY_DN1548_c0_g5_i2.p1 TRINITY_DN1548_c0_g5~~TRINITY_DN1548_c0_g5_i2.p1  ORF type:complete len:3052 (-),score=1213.08 TRINITY_DN1548_c0_g5_i2:66-8516(-)